MSRYKKKVKTVSIVGREAEFEGTLKNEKGIRIEGKVQGEIQAKGEVIVGRDALVEANIQAPLVSIGGKVVGNVDCQGRVELFPSASLEGNVKAADLTIPEGAFFNGECKMTFPQEARQDISIEYWREYRLSQHACPRKTKVKKDFQDRSGSIRLR